MKRRSVAAALWISASVIACSSVGCAREVPLKVPPVTTARPGEDISAPIAADADAVRTRKDRIREDYFGTTVEDPYRWLEDGDSVAVREWTSRQNTATRERIDAIAGMDGLRREIRELLEVGYVGAPSSRPPTPPKRTTISLWSIAPKTTGVISSRAPRLNICATMRLVGASSICREG